jgi:hypothetical protein
MATPRFSSGYERANHSTPPPRRSGRAVELSGDQFMASATCNAAKRRSKNSNAALRTLGKNTTEVL